MTNVIIPPPVMQFVDDSGNPYSGAKAFTYTAGTTNKVTTYQTQAGTANTNPIILDSLGMCKIWVPVGTTIKIVLAPSTDSDPPVAPIFTVDNLTGSPYASLVDANGVSVVTVTAGVGTPVNYTQFTNAAAGSNPIITPTGASTDIGLNIQPKGAGVLSVKGTASTQGKIRLYENTANGTNYIEIAAPAAITSNVTFQLPDAPVNFTNCAFNVSLGSTQNVLTDTLTKVLLNTELFDTNNNFDPSINHRFTPTVAGYYYLFGQVQYADFPGDSNRYVRVYVLKNGTDGPSADSYPQGTANSTATASISWLQYFNGSTDYAELWTKQSSTGTEGLQTTGNTFLLGYKIGAV